MSETKLAIPAKMECDGCGMAIEGTWDVPCSAFGRRRCLDTSSAAQALANAAAEQGWLVRGTAALCPECLGAAVAGGNATFPPPTSAAQAIDQLALARTVRKLRKAGFDGNTDR